MRLVRARVTNYKSIDDSGWVTIDDVTCLVGKNESGKTAFLQALRRLNPESGVDARFDLTDYPRKGYVNYRRAHKDSPAVAVSAEMELSEREVGEIEATFGGGVLTSRRVVVTRDYEGRRHWELGPAVDDETSSPIDAETRLDEADGHHQADESWPGPAARSNGLGLDVKQRIIDEYLERAIPRFVYFDDYSTMRGRISIQDLRQRRNGPGSLDEADRTFLSLLSLVGIELDDLEHLSSYEQLKAELEAASIGISDEIFEFWNQNRELRVDFDLSPADPTDPPPLNSGTILHVRIWNNRHRVSVPFDERSRGFVWFFSFLSYFSKLVEEEGSDLVLLLDEPGLNLHAMAQNDFLKFIDERLQPKHQVIYTTHSPFMINLEHLNRVRTVQDMDDLGTVVRDDTAGNDQETVFPLQVALGHRMAQTLFLAPHCLMVNASSDLIYLQVLGEMAAARNRPRLDPRWVVIPVGGADNLATFASLLGENYVSVAVLMDVTPTSKERVERINAVDPARRRSPIKWVEVTRVRDADIEDLFDPSLYLRLVNEAYADELPAPLTLKTITESNPRIVKRVGDYFESAGIAGGQFDPYRPAAYLLQRHMDFRDGIDSATIDRAASLFERVNSLLPGSQSPPGSRSSKDVEALSVDNLVRTA